MTRTLPFLIIFLVFLAWTGPGAASDNPLLIHPDQIQPLPVRFVPPRTERIVLKNGMILHFIENHELPLIKLTAVFRAGSNYDPAGKEGLSELTAAVMRAGGISGTTADSLEDEIDFRAAYISFAASMESSSAQASMYKKDAERVMRLFSGMVRHPSFEKGKMETARSLMAESLARIYDDPQKLAFREFRRIIYANDPRGRLQTLSSLERLTREDLISFHSRHYQPENTMISVTGDLTRSEAVSMIERWFGSWQPETGKKVSELPPPLEGRKGAVYFLNKEIPQSTVLLGHIVPGKGDRDFYALTLLDFILGSGGFRSMISQEIRNKRGLAYSAGSFYAARAQYGILNAYAMTGCASTSEVVSLLKSMIKSLRDHPVSESELAWAKKSIGNRFIFSLESPEQIAYLQMMLEFEGLPGDFLDTFQEKIDCVRIQDVQAAADKYLIPERTRILIVGDEAGISTPLASFGEVTRIDWTK